MVSVTEETPYPSGFLATVTEMTLMTVVCRGFLDGGGGYVFHRRWISSIVQSLESGTCSTGFWGGNRCHHGHHYWHGVLDLGRGQTPVFSPVYGVSPRGCCDILVTGVTAITLMALIYGLILLRGCAATS